MRELIDGKHGRIRRFRLQRCRGSRVQFGPEDSEDRQRHGTDQRQGVHSVLVRARHRDQVELQRVLCALLAPGEGPGGRGRGVTGTLATIKRADGSVQATWNGHPLYTYAGDTAPGQAKGNGLNLSGGVWHEVTVAGTAAPAATHSAKFPPAGRILSGY